MKTMIVSIQIHPNIYGLWNTRPWRGWPWLCTLFLWIPTILLSSRGWLCTDQTWCAAPLPIMKTKAVEGRRGKGEGGGGGGRGITTARLRPDAVAIRLRSPTCMTISGAQPLQQDTPLCSPQLVSLDPPMCTSWSASLESSEVSSMMTVEARVVPARSKSGMKLGLPAR